MDQYAYFVLSETGCSCCRSDNRIEGPHLSLDDARFSRDSNYNSGAFASQYADRGRHSIGKIPYEKLADGRLIIGDRIFQPDDLVMDHPDHYQGLNLTYLSEESRA